MSCGIRRMYVEDDIIRESNAILLEKAVWDLAAQITTIPILNTDSKYVVMSSEDVDDRNNPLLSNIEDGIVSALASAGFNILERDNDVLIRLLYQEGSEGLSAVVVPPTSAQLIDNEEGTELPKYNLDYGRKVQIVSTQVGSTGTGSLIPADYVISYRIIEQGVKYIRIEGVDEFGVSQFKRQANVKTHIRVIDAKTSNIIWANNLSGIREDIVPRWMLKKLESSDYKFYSQSFPLSDK
jgi:curli biogenesis system outer membrane secretion channel CsgG